MFATPAPDPAPHSGNQSITYAQYQYVVPAESKVTHERLPGLGFRCHVHVNGTRKCVLFREQAA